MKKITAILILCSLSTMSFAQHKLKSERLSPEKKQEMKIHKLETELNLTPAQVEKIEGIDAKYAPIENEHKEKREALHQEIRKTNIQKREEIKLVLTPEQLKKMEEKKEVRKAEHLEHRREQIQEKTDTPKK